MRTINEIILHCSATPEGKDIKAKTIREWHLGNGWQDIGYNYVIDLDGTVENGRSELIAGAHCTGHNSHSIGICYVGGMDKNNKYPKDTRTDKQKESLYHLVHQIMDKYKLKLTNVHCHNEYANKACPSFNIDVFRKEYKEHFGL